MFILRWSSLQYIGLLGVVHWFRSLGRCWFRASLLLLTHLTIKVLRCLVFSFSFFAFCYIYFFLFRFYIVFLSSVCTFLVLLNLAFSPNYCGLVLYSLLDFLWRQSRFHLFFFGGSSRVLSYPACPGYGIVSLVPYCKGTKTFRCHWPYIAIGWERAIHFFLTLRPGLLLVVNCLCLY